MCVWPFVCYVHQTDTTDTDSNERRRFRYASKCSQCGAKLTPHTRVAAHVSAYPLFCLNCCVGLTVFKTTCKKCNNQNKSGKRWIDNKSFFGLRSFREPTVKIESGKKLFVWPSVCHKRGRCVSKQQSVHETIRDIQITAFK